MKRNFGHRRIKSYLNLYKQALFFAEKRNGEGCDTLKSVCTSAVNLFQFFLFLLLFVFDIQCSFCISAKTVEKRQKKNSNLILPAKQQWVVIAKQWFGKNLIAFHRMSRRKLVLYTFLKILESFGWNMSHF